MGTFTACSLDTDDILPAADEIIVDAQFGSGGADTRAAIIGDGNSTNNKGNTDAATLPLDITLLHKTAAGIESETQWSAKPDAKDAVLSSDLKIQTGIKYDDTDHTVLTAVYPRVSGSSISTDNVSYDIASGAVDVLCANTADAGYKGAKNQTPNLKFTFDHMLSQMVVQVKAANAASITRWGKIKSMQLSSIPTAIVVKLPSPDGLTQGKGYATTAASPAVQDVTFTENDTNNAAPELTLDAAKHATFGNIMFLPGASNLQLVVDTENFKSYVVDVPVTQFGQGLTDYLPGMKYILKLTFNDDTIVFDAASEIVAWDEVNSTADIEF
jgi:hypothetical protein